MRSEKRNAVDYDGKKLFQPRNTVRINVNLDNDQHKLQIALYKHVTEYVRYCFGKAKHGNINATGLVMVMMQNWPVAVLLPYYLPCRPDYGVCRTIV